MGGDTGGGASRPYIMKLPCVMLFRACVRANVSVCLGGSLSLCRCVLGAVGDILLIGHICSEKTGGLQQYGYNNASTELHRLCLYSSLSGKDLSFVAMHVCNQFVSFGLLLSQSECFYMRVSAEVFV